MAEEKIVLGDNSKKNQTKKVNLPVEEGTNIPVNDDSVNTSVNQSTEKTASDIAKEHNIPEQYLDMEFKVPTTEIELPSRGVFYPKGKKSVTIKYLTAEEDDILYSPDLIKSGRVLDVLLDKAVMDRDLRPEDMLSGDRNYLLIEMRKTGLGNDYVPGEITCPSCGQD